MDHSEIGTTEARYPATTNIDTFTTAQIVQTILAEDARVVPVVAAVGDTITQLTQEVVRRMADSGRLIYAGGRAAWQP